MKRILCTALFCLFSCAYMARAADPLLKYHTFDLAYNHVKLDDIGSGNGLTTRLSYKIIDYAYLDGSYIFESGSHFDLNSFRYGGGVFFPIAPVLHIVGKLGGEHQSLKIVGEETHQQDRLYLGPELRFKALNMLEIDGGYTWRGGKDSGENDFNINALLTVLDNMAINLGINFLSDTGDRYMAGIRFGF